MNKRAEFKAAQGDLSTAAVLWALFLFIAGAAIIFTAGKHGISAIECLRRLVFEEGFKGKVLLFGLFAVPLIYTLRCFAYKLKKRRFLEYGVPLVCDIEEVIRRPKRADRLILRLPDGKTIKSDGFYGDHEMFSYKKCTVYELNGRYMVTELYT